MSIEAMKLALEALEDLFVKNKVDVGAINALRQAIAEAEKQDNAYIYASNLAKTIWQKHYMKESPKFALLDTIEGVLTQIDNMTCRLVREKPAQPEQEPDDLTIAYLSGFYDGANKYAPQRNPEVE